jgi:hypothetical protein
VASKRLLLSDGRLAHFRFARMILAKGGKQGELSPERICETFSVSRELEG